MLKVLHLSKSDLDGGAAIAAFRLHKALQAQGANSYMLVDNKLSDDPFVFGANTYLERLMVKIRRRLDSLPERLLYPRKRTFLFSCHFLGNSKLIKKIKKINPDIVHIHWTSHAFLRIESIPKIPYPIVWTLHDLWPLTGGCHYTYTCEGYKQFCGNCPVLSSTKSKDLSFINIQRKIKNFSHQKITFISPSSWLIEKVKSSRVFSQKNVFVIGNGLDTDIFTPLERLTSRQALGLDLKKIYLLFNANDALKNPYKGLELLIQALSRLNHKEKYELLIIGSDQSPNSPQFPIHTQYFGKIKDPNRLAQIYSAADMTVCPSKQETFGQILSESLSCETPCVAFASTGPDDIIDHLKNGYLAKAYDVEDFCRGIEWVTSNPPSKGVCRQKVLEQFAAALVAKKHLELYQKIKEE